MDTEKLASRDLDEPGDKIFSQVVKAGRRTYFVDVRSTRANDYYITVTESRKRTLGDGTTSFDRHKIFLYKEDFAKFESGLMAAMDFVKREKSDYFQYGSEETRPMSLDEEFDSL